MIHLGSTAKISKKKNATKIYMLLIWGLGYCFISKILTTLSLKILQKIANGVTGRTELALRLVEQE